MCANAPITKLFYVYVYANTYASSVIRTEAEARKYGKQIITEKPSAPRYTHIQSDMCLYPMC